MSVLHPVRHAIKLMEELVLVPFLVLLGQVISVNELVSHLFHFCLEVQSLRSRVLVKNYCKFMSQKSPASRKEVCKYVSLIFSSGTTHLYLGFKNPNFKAKVMSIL